MRVTGPLFRSMSTRVRSFGHDPGVLLLSKMTGQDVRGADGVVFGRLADLTIRLDEQADDLHLVERLLVKRRRATDALLPWAAIESFENTVRADTRRP